MHRFICRGAQGSIPGIDEKLAPLLIARGADTYEKAHAFLHPSAQQLHDPMQLFGMEKAVAIIRETLKDGAPLIVYGDYDCDGVCASAILVETLTRLCGTVRAYIPHRKAEGYGLNCEAVRKLAQKGACLITVDCGITSLEEVALAKDLGLRVIITDHHTPPETLPDADAVIHAALGDYPCKALCGAGTAWKLACALEARIVHESIDLAALATIADMVPLLHENRVIAALGLQKMTNSARPGLRALMTVAAIDLNAPVSGTQAAFLLAPRVNACGRMDTARIALDLMLSRSDAQAQTLANKADQLNAQRKNVESRIFALADEQVQRMDLYALRAIVVEGDGWESGVVGLAAGRLSERYGYPSVVLSREGDTCVGSARSASGVDLYQALYECRDLFIRFGGHKQAAGLTIEAQHVPAFRERLSTAVAKQLAGQIPMPQTAYDSEITLNDVTVPFIEQLSALEPFGMENPAPVYLLRQADVLSTRAVGADNSHLKLVLSQNAVQRDAIAFHMGARAGVLHGQSDLAVTPVINSFRGKASAECRIEAVGQSGTRFTSDISAEAHAILQELSAFCRIENIYPLHEITPFDERAWYHEDQGTLFLCRTAETANRFAALYPACDAVRGDDIEPRAYSAVWLCDKLSRRGPYRRVVLCDGLLCPQETAQLHALYPEAQFFAASKTQSLRAAFAALQCSVEALRDLYRQLRAGAAIDLGDPRTAAMAQVLCHMELLALTPTPQLLPMQKRAPEDDLLYQLIRDGGT